MNVQVEILIKLAGGGKLTMSEKKVTLDDVRKLLKSDEFKKGYIKMKAETLVFKKTDSSSSKSASNQNPLK